MLEEYPTDKKYRRNVVYTEIFRDNLNYYNKAVRLFVCPTYKAVRLFVCPTSSVRLWYISIYVNNIFLLR